MKITKKEEIFQLHFCSSKISAAILKETSTLITIINFISVCYNIEKVTQKNDVIYSKRMSRDNKVTAA